MWDELASAGITECVSDLALIHALQLLELFNVMGVTLLSHVLYATGGVAWQAALRGRVTARVKQGAPLGHLTVTSQ